jgi:Trp operon repressor
MPNTSPAHPVQVGQELQAAFNDFVILTRDRLTNLDPEKEQTLSLIVSALLRVEIEQKQMASTLGVSRTTISRWAHGRNIPRSEGYRRWVAESLLGILNARVPKRRRA